MLNISETFSLSTPCIVFTTGDSPLLTSSLLGQIVQATVDYLLWRNQGSLLNFNLGNIPLPAWLLVSVSPLLVVLVNEVVKLHEIR